MFTDEPVFVGGLIASICPSNVFAIVTVLPPVPLHATFLGIRFSIIGPIIQAG